MVENWIIPCNIKYFDVIRHFDVHDEVIWKRDRAIELGDIVLIYVGAPYSAILFRCRVIDADVDMEEVSDFKLGSQLNFLRSKLI